MCDVSWRQRRGAHHITCTRVCVCVSVCPHTGSLTPLVTDACYEDDGWWWWGRVTFHLRRKINIYFSLHLCVQIQSLVPSSTSGVLNIVFQPLLFQLPALRTPIHSIQSFYSISYNVIDDIIKTTIIPFHYLFVLYMHILFVFSHNDFSHMIFLSLPKSNRGYSLYSSSTVVEKISI